MTGKQQAPVLMQAAELVERLEISTSTLRRWSKQDDFPAPIKEGRCVFYDIEAVAAWVMASGKDLSTRSQSTADVCLSALVFDS